MSFEEFWAALYRAVPSLEGKLRLTKVVYKEKQTRALFLFTSDVLVGERDFALIRRALSRSFPNLAFSLRISSPSLQDDFWAAPSKYRGIVSDILQRKHPAFSAWRSDMDLASENGRVVLLLPNAFAEAYCRAHQVPEQIQTILWDLFELRPEVTVRIQGAREETLARLEQQRNAEKLLEEERRELARRREEIQQRAQAAREEKKRRQIRGKAITDPPQKIEELNSETGLCVLAGKLLDVDTKEISKGRGLLVVFHVTDYTGTMTCKMFLYYRSRRPQKDEEAEEEPITDEERAAVQDVVTRLKECDGVMVQGECGYDDFSRECTVRCASVQRIDLPRRQDNSEEKRIELHAHTKMSNMDAVVSAEDLIATAASWGHKAIAITDHGVVQAFPEAFSAAKKHKIKLIPGVEGYLAEDQTIVRAETPDARPLDTTPVVVLDFETTGLDIRNDRIIEIGAVRLENGEITASYSQLINPGVALKPKITEITGITDQELAGQPTIQEQLPLFLQFIGDAPIAAHNADFDTGILDSELRRQGIDRHFTVLDTLTFARKCYPELRSHKLGAVCKKLGVSLKNAHRAVHDATATAKVLKIMFSEAQKRGATSFDDLDSVVTGSVLGDSHHIILLATSQEGLFHLNKLISISHLESFRRHPNMLRKDIQKYRQGLLVGSACAAGELYQAILQGKPEKKIEQIARFYDFLEVQPIGNNGYLVREGTVKNEEELRQINRTIVALGEKLGLPVVATGDVHFLNPEDAIFRAILQDGHGYEDAEQQPPLYLKTTEEMLTEFRYLGEEKAREIVIQNPETLLNRIGEITLFPKHPEGKTTFSPVWEEAPDDIRRMVEENSHRMYGDVLPEIVQKRLDKEMASIIGYGYATLYDIASKLVRKSLADGYLVGSRGSVGSSLVATMCGITEVNPLPPHYRCPDCREAFFDVPPEAGVGVDLPDRSCPHCGKKLVKDGFNIPFEVFLGFKGDKVPDIDLNFSGEYQGRAHKYIEELFGTGFVYRAGTIGTLAEKTAYGYVMKYLEKRGITVSEAEKNRLANGCVNVKRTTGQHPGGIVVLPKAYDICQFTAVQHPADDTGTDIITTHYDFNSMHDILVKLDCLGHDDPTIIHMLERLTGVNYKEIPLDDPDVMSLFTSPAALGVTEDQIQCETGTLGVPEFGTSFVRGVLMDTRPSSMEELIRISGLSHGTNVWQDNAKTLVTSGQITLREAICTRDDIMNYLISMGVAPKMSFDTMESVRKGKGLKPEMEQAMIAANVPSWFLDSCKKIGYMFPKGHAVAYVTMALRIAWFKVHRPLAYYAAYFSIRCKAFDAGTMLVSTQVIRDRMAQLHAMDKKTQKEDDELGSLEMVLEFYERGFSFLPLDLYKSDVTEFLMEGERSLRVPFTSYGGVGEAAAQSIVAERGQPYISIEDLKNRTRVSTAVLDTMKNAGALRELKESNQVSMTELLGF